MRSDRVHRALAQGMNRFEVCQLVSKGVKATHRTGSRFEDTINDALEHLGAARPDAQRTLTRTDKSAAKPLDPAA
jgi:hypothetical protein